MYCAHCGTKNDEGLESCDRCGELLERIDPSHATHLGIRSCPECKTANAPRARFCSECGLNLDDVVATSGALRPAQPTGPGGPIGTRRSPVSPAPSTQRDPETSSHAEIRRPAPSPPSTVSADRVRTDRGPEDLRDGSDVPLDAQNDSGTPEAKLPVELRGWNWGGLLLPFVWGPANRVWLGLAVLLVFIPPMSGALVLLIYGPAALFVGMRGNELAWRARKWDSIEHFRMVQAQWTRWGLVGFGLLLITGLMFLASNGG